MSDAPQAIPPSALPSSVVHVTRPVEPGAIVVIDMHEFVGDPEAWLEAVHDEIEAATGHGEFYLLAVATPSARVEVFPEGALDAALDAAVGRKVRADLAELADLIVMVAANSHCAYFEDVRRRANVIINRFVALTTEPASSEEASR